MKRKTKKTPNHFSGSMVVVLMYNRDPDLTIDRTPEPNLGPDSISYITK